MKVGTNIVLSNREFRSPDHLVLLAIKDNLYYFQVIPEPSMAEFWRVIAGNNPDDPWTKPHAIDPPAGPYIAVGGDLLGMKIKEIEKAKIAWVLTLEKNE